MRNNNITKRFDKHGQVGQTMTWIVATIVILLILFLFVAAVNASWFIKQIGLGLDIKDKGSLIGDQQTLFAILSMNNGEIKTLLEQENFEVAEERVDVILEDLRINGLECLFSVYPKYTIAAIPKLSVDSGYSGLIPELSVDINDLEVRLACE